MICIEVIDLVKRFGERLALNEISFNVYEGEIFGLLGPNGAGKTTTLRILSGILKPDEGDVYVSGFDVIKEAENIRSLIGYLPEISGLYERLSVWDNLEFYGKIYGMRGRDLEERIMELLRLFDLDDRKFEKVGSLSKGLRRRVAVARALVHDPSILLLDQPTSDLDPAMARLIRNVIRSLNKDGGKTILICTHNLTEAEELCDRVAVIDKGIILGIGSLSELAGELSTGQFFKIVSLRPIKDYLEVFAEAGEVIELKEYEVVIRVSESNKVSELIRRLVFSGCDLLEVRMLRPSLEDVYLKLVRDREV